VLTLQGSGVSGGAVGACGGVWAGVLVPLRGTTQTSPEKPYEAHVAASSTNSRYSSAKAGVASRRRRISGKVDSFNVAIYYFQ
jgi:hypothetical protein